MKMKLLPILTFFYVGICFSQDYGTYQSTPDGKLFYLAPEASPIVSQENSMLPMALELDWNTPDYNISNHPTVDSWEPRMAVGTTDKVYVVYNDNHTNGLQKIMFRKKVGVEDWTAPIFVDTGGEIGGRNNHFPAIAVSPNGDLHVTYNVWAMENVRNYIGYSYYNASTDTWSDGLKISDLGGTVHHTTSHHDIYSTEDNLPVVVWGYDNRENQVNEEIYMKYFDGAAWSADIAVSDITDNMNAGYPHIKSIGNNKALIVYSEGASGNMELRFRMYDETSHTLSETQAITSENISGNNYILTTAGTGEVMVLTIHKETAPVRDVFRIYDYDHSSDSFTPSSHIFEIAANAGGLLKRIDMDCSAEGDCGIIFTDFMANNNSFLEYNLTTGFGSPLIINEENPGIDPPHARFDPDGNLHVVWSDFRNDDGQGFDEREVIYKMGVNTLLGVNSQELAIIAVYPNPSDGNFTVITPETCTLQIIDIMGKILYSQTVASTSTIDINLSSGTYFLRFTNGKTTEVKKLLVK